MKLLQVLNNIRASRVFPGCEMVEVEIQEVVRNDNNEVDHINYLTDMFVKPTMSFITSLYKYHDYDVHWTTSYFYNPDLRITISIEKPDK